MPESRLYAQLVEFENKLDATVSRKKLDIQEALAKPMKIKRVLRVFVSNTAADQYTHERAGEASAFDAMPSWTLRVEGRLLDPPNTRKSSAVSAKFSSFVKSIYVELQRDASLYPEGNTIEVPSTLSH